ncbi:MAG: hypothetical protein H5T36_00595 [Methanobacteriaceae archaeon]|nr:hypothetical protein [Methanobacteriaceae archaeon]
MECQYSIFQSLAINPQRVQVYQIQDSKNIDKIHGQIGMTNYLVKLFIMAG